MAIKMVKHWLMYHVVVVVIVVVVVTGGSVVVGGGGGGDGNLYILTLHCISHYPATQWRKSPV